MNFWLLNLIISIFSPTFTQTQRQTHNNSNYLSTLVSDGITRAAKDLWESGKSVTLTTVGEQQPPPPSGCPAHLRLTISIKQLLSVAAITVHILWTQPVGSAGSDTLRLSPPPAPPSFLPSSSRRPSGSLQKHKQLSTSGGLPVKMSHSAKYSTFFFFLASSAERRRPLLSSDLCNHGRSFNEER